MNSAVLTNLSFHRFELKGSHVRKLLQDSIYSDKRIFIQELASNARDSIIRMYGERASERGEIAVVLNADDGMITIADNGTGMSRKTFLEIYRVYGNSDKWSSTSEIGCYGIGSKSPLAVTDAFTVESWSVEDRKYYRVLVTSEGIRFLEEHELADDRHGCAVHIPYSVRESVTALREKLEDTVRFWNLRTTLTIIEDGQETRETLGFTDFDRYASEKVRRSCYGDVFRDALLHIDNRVVNAYLIPRYGRLNIYVNGIKYSQLLSFEFGSVSGEVLIKKPQILDITANREKIAENHKKEKFLKFLSCAIFKAILRKLSEGTMSSGALREWLEVTDRAGPLHRAHSLLSEKTKLTETCRYWVFSPTKDRARVYRRFASGRLIDILTRYDPLYFTTGENPVLTGGQKNHIKMSGSKVCIVMLDRETLKTLGAAKINLRHFSEIPESEKAPEARLRLEIWRGGTEYILTEDSLADLRDITLVFVGRDKISRYKKVKLGGYWFVARRNRRTMKILSKKGIRCLTEDGFLKEVEEMELPTSRGMMKVKELATHSRITARVFIHRKVLEKIEDNVVVRIPPFSEHVFSKLMKLERTEPEWDAERNLYYFERLRMLDELPAHFSILRNLRIQTPQEVHALFEFIDRVDIKEGVT